MSSLPFNAFAKIMPDASNPANLMDCELGIDNNILKYKDANGNLYTLDLSSQSLDLYNPVIHSILQDTASGTIGIGKDPTSLAAVNYTSGMTNSLFNDILLTGTGGHTNLTLLLKDNNGIIMDAISIPSMNTGDTYNICTGLFTSSTGSQSKYSSLYPTYNAGYTLQFIKTAKFSGSSSISGDATIITDSRNILSIVYVNEINSTNVSYVTSASIGSDKKTITGLDPSKTYDILVNTDESITTTPKIVYQIIITSGAILEYIQNAIAKLSQTVNSGVISNESGNSTSGVDGHNIASGTLPESAFDSALTTKMTDIVNSITSNLTVAETYTDTKISSLINSSPTILSTLKQLADAINDDANFATDITTAFTTLINNLAGTGRTSETVKGNADAIASTNTAVLNISNTVTNHSNNMNNPHDVTKSQVGLGNVSNVDTTNAANINIADAGNIITATNVEGALQELASTINITKNFMNSNIEAISELLMQQDIAGKVVSTNLNKFYTDFTHSMSYSDGKVDNYSQYVGALSAGTTSLIVPYTTAISSGAELSLHDGSYYEDIIAQSVATTSKTADYSSITRTITNNAYNPSRTARPLMLSNGWMVVWMSDANTKMSLLVSKDNGLTWTQLCYRTISTSTSYTWAMCCFGNRIYYTITTPASTAVRFYSFDAIAIDPNTDLSTLDSVSTQYISTDTSIGSGCSIAINSTGTALTVVWCSKTTTYTNSFNIRSAKGTINADGSITWTTQSGTAGVENSTTNNTTGQDYSYPYVIYDKNNNPVICATYVDGSNDSIVKINCINNLWGSAAYIYNSGAYPQTSPVVTMQKGGSAVGRLWCTWYGLDSTDTACYNIRVSYSDDGLTWSTPQKLTSGNTYSQACPTITSDINGNIYILWHGLRSGSYQTVNQIIFNGSTWSSITVLSTNTTNNCFYPVSCDNYSGFSSPMTTWQDNQRLLTTFYGKFNYNVTTINLGSATVNNYNCAVLYRSNNNGINFGNIYSQFDRTTPTPIINSAYTTSATARPQILSNGWQVTCAYDNTSLLKFYVSKDNGATSSFLTQIGTGVFSSFSICSYGTIIYVHALANLCAYFTKFDATTISTATQSINIIDTQTAIGSGCSIAVNSTGTVLTAVWCSKNSTYPNSFNIRSAKSVDGGTTWTTQGGSAGPEQQTVANTTGADNTLPYVIYNENDIPVIFHVYSYTSNLYYIMVTSPVISGTLINTGTTGWGNKAIYQPGNYIQSNITVTLQKYGINAGRVWCTWFGFDSVNTAHKNIKVSYSDDNGLTWSAPQNITNDNVYGQYYPSITNDINGNVYIIWQGTSALSVYNRIRQIIWNGTTWGSITEVTTNTTADMLYPSTCDNYNNFTTPISIWQDNVNNRVSFYGVFNKLTSSLKNVIRMNIKPYQSISQLIAFITKSDLSGYTITGFSSIVANSAIETYMSLTPTTTVLGSVDEIAFVGTVSTPNTKVTLKLILQRVNITDNTQITKIIGGVE